MKKTILSFLIIFSSIFCFSQSKPYLKDSILYLTIENRLGVEVPVRFQFFEDSVLDIIKKEDYFKKWLSNYDKYTSPTLKEEWKDVEPICIFLSHLIRNSSHLIFRLKKKSYSLIENSKGMITLSLKDDTILFNFSLIEEDTYGITKNSDILVKVDYGVGTKSSYRVIKNK